MKRVITHVDVCQGRERAPLIDDTFQQRQRQADQQVDFNTNIIIEREEAIREIESAMCVRAWPSVLGSHVLQDGGQRDIQGPQRAYHRARRAARYVSSLPGIHASHLLQTPLRTTWRRRTRR